MNLLKINRILLAIPFVPYFKLSGLLALDHNLPAFFREIFIELLIVFWVVVIRNWRKQISLSFEPAF